MVNFPFEILHFLAFYNGMCYFYYFKKVKEEVKAQEK